jgi:cell division GTPase FtsZ
MSVTTENIKLEDSKVVDDLDNDVMAALRAKMAKKEETVKEEMPIKIVAEKQTSIKFGVVGSGQAGSRLAEAFYAHGYDTVVFNTAQQDLEHIAVPPAHKCFLKYGLGGAAKNLEIGKAAAEEYRDLITEMIHDKLGDCQALLLCLSLGGGSGAGSCETMVDIMAATGKPLVVMTVLPMAAEDSLTKHNALETLAKLARETQNKRVHNLIVIDNAKIEAIYSDTSQLDFYKVSNKAIVDPIHMLNHLSTQPSETKALDSMEWARIMTDGGGLCVYGEMSITDFAHPTAIAEAVIDNLTNGLLATGFDLKQTKYAGMVVVARRDVLDKIDNSAVSYAMNLVDETCGNPTATFRGTYSSDDVPEGVIKVYSIFSGLGLPEARVSQLKKETASLAEKTKTKDVERNLSLKLDTGKDEVVSAADKVRQQIASRNSAFGSLLNSSVQDRRRK